MSLHPDKHIVQLFGKSFSDGPNTSVQIESVLLADGTRLLQEQITQEQWDWMAEQGLPVNHLQEAPMNREQRRAAKKGMH